MNEAEFERGDFYSHEDSMSANPTSRMAFSTADLQAVRNLIAVRRTELLALEIKEHHLSKLAGERSTERLRSVHAQEEIEYLREELEAAEEEVENLRTTIASLCEDTDLDESVPITVREPAFGDPGKSNSNGHIDAPAGDNGAALQIPASGTSQPLPADGPIATPPLLNQRRSCYKTDTYESFVVVPHGDGVLQTPPNDYFANDSPYANTWFRVVGTELLRARRGTPKDGVAYRIPRLPPNYTNHFSVRDDKTIDYHVLGHPSGKPFDSGVQLARHLVHLERYNNSDHCLCFLCPAGKEKRNRDKKAGLLKRKSRSGVHKKQNERKATQDTEDQSGYSGGITSQYDDDLLL
ncbi:hypothetical protein EJ08DRAFT_706532 [Tothia fuscella]|uniref:Cryptic loci regulator 2 N-terminal domain-containing protein n=1 Tax=Tothia fuscella TaxID=1048955 RepID=A0A9P4NFN0_9PEZI|nr:hypothetical protein EJ08DRAFT_706532 [Tothia fuscella]